MSPAARLRSGSGLNLIFAVAALASSSGALAQTEGPPQTAPDASPAANTNVPSDVIVTARKREERLQDIPATIDVLGGAQLAQTGVTSTQQIEAQVPGLSFGNSGFNGALVGLRGVSSQRGFTGDEAAVAVHVDGVFQPQSGQALARLFDVERIEVLKGPQGTEYGRNANAGVINIISAAPSDELKGYGQVSYGRFDTFRGEGAINLPLAEGQALRLSAAGASGDGPIRNRLNDRSFGDNHFVAGRARYRGEFGDTTVNATAQYIHDTSALNGAQTPAIRGSAAKRTDLATGFYDTLVDVPTHERRNNFNWSVQVDHALGAAAFRSLTGGSGFDTRSVTDLTLQRSTVPNGQNFGTQHGTSVSQEFQLFARTPTAFDWRLGLYYAHSDVTETRNYFNDNPQAPPAAQLYQDFRLRQKGDAYAAFGVLGYSFASNLRATVGLRYSREHKDQAQNETIGFEPPNGTARSCAVVAPGTFETCNSAGSLGARWSGLTGRADLTWKIAPDSSLYANYGRGFRSGAIGGELGIDNFFDRAFGGTGALGLKKLGQEKVDAFEVGTKNLFLDRRLTINIAAFYTRFKDQLVLIADPAQNFRVIEGNIGRSTIKGVDALIAFRPVRGVQLSANSEFLDTRVDDLGNIDPANAGGVSIGNRLPRAPRFSTTAAIDYTVDAGPGALTLRGEFSHRSFQWLDLQNSLPQRRINLTNISARYELKNSGFYLFADGRNIFGEQYLVAGGVPSTAGPAFNGAARPGERASWEVGAGLRF